MQYPQFSFKPKFKIVWNYYKKASYKQFQELSSGLLEQVQIICSCYCYNVLLGMPRSMEYLMAKVQAFYCNIVFLSFPCNCYTTRLEDLTWLAELSRCLKTNILFITSVKYMKEIVVGASHYGPEREIQINQLLEHTNYKQAQSIMCFLCMFTFSGHHYFISYYENHRIMEWANMYLQWPLPLSLLWVDFKWSSNKRGVKGSR